MSVTKTAPIPDENAPTSAPGAVKTVDVQNLKLRLEGPAGIVEILKGIDISINASTTNNG